MLTIIMKTKPDTIRTSGFVITLIKAGTNCKGNNILARNTDTFSVPRKSNTNKMNTNEETMMRILT
jgi:hypothetical protein